MLVLRYSAHDGATRWMLTNLDGHHFVLQECLHGLNEHLGDLRVLFSILFRCRMHCYKVVKYVSTKTKKSVHLPRGLIGDRKSINKDKYVCVSVLPSSLCCAPDLGSNGKMPRLTGLLCQEETSCQSVCVDQLLMQEEHHTLKTQRLVKRLDDILTT